MIKVPIHNKMMSLDISDGKGAERKKERKKSEQRERERKVKDD